MNYSQFSNSPRDTTFTTLKKYLNFQQPVLLKAVLPFRSVKLNIAKVRYHLDE